MELYLAPMEEITTYIFRNVQNKHFGCVDKYFTPFVTPNQNKILKTKEGREIVPEHNKGLNVVPQVLTNNAEHFNELAETMRELGYFELNLNFGCPSNTVAKKYKGSGILRDTDILERFLDGIFVEKNNDLKISVKTRLGYSSDEYFDDIISIYNNYPIYELIIHPRIQKEFYSGLPHMDKFDYSYNNCKMPLGYNGNVFNKEDYLKIVNDYPNIKSVMIGRGAVCNPGIFREIRTGKKMEIQELQLFTEELYDSYTDVFGAKDSLFKMKEVWSYLKDNFADIDKELKIIRKTSEPAQYKAAVREIFSKYV